MKIRGIVQYAHLLKPSAPKSSERLSYNVTLLLPENDPQLAQIEQETDTAMLNGFPSGAPAGALRPVKKDSGVPGYVSLKIKSSADFEKPHFVDAQCQPMMDPGAESSIVGQYVWAEVTKFQSYNNLSKGVNAYLGGVMATGEAGPIPTEQLSSKKSAADMFRDVAGAAPTAAPVAPPPAPPVAAPAPAAPVMTAAANGVPYESFIAQGWTHDQLVQNGYVAPAPHGF